MTTLTLRSGKGSALTFAELDTNFSNLNTDLTTATNSILDTSDVNGLIDAKFVPANYIQTSTNQSATGVKTFTDGIVAKGLTYPVADGTSGQFITTNASGTLSWGTATAYTNTDWNTQFTTKSTSNLSEGTNLYYTSGRADARVDAGFTAKSTSDLSEGTNLYFTNARVDEYINASILTTDISEGTRLYFTEARAIAALTAGTNIAIAGDGTISSTDTNTTYSVGDGGLTQKNFTTALNTKLGAIEALADVTDTTNVVAALTAGTNVAIAANGTISSTDTNTTYSVGDGGLTQKNFTTTLNTKLGAIEALADVTDTTNVVAALTAGTNISIASNGTISSAAAYDDADVDTYINASILTTDISEGTRLYYTTARADARIAAASIFDLTDVTSGTVVTNLNADKVDGFHGIGIYDLAGNLLNG